MGEGYNKIKEPPPNARPSILSVCTRVYKLWIYPGLGFSIYTLSTRPYPSHCWFPFDALTRLLQIFMRLFFSFSVVNLLLLVPYFWKAIHHPWSRMLDNPCIYIMIELSKKIVKNNYSFCLISLYIHNDRIVQKNSKNNYSFCLISLYTHNDRIVQKNSKNNYSFWELWRWLWLWLL